MPTEAETLEAMVNRWKRLEQKHIDLARRLRQRIEYMEEIRRGMLLGGDEGLTEVELATEPGQDKKPRGAVTDGLREYIGTTGVQQFTPAQAVTFLRERLQVPNSKELYNSAYRALTRMVEKGDLLKEGEQFTVANKAA